MLQGPDMVASASNLSTEAGEFQVETHPEQFSDLDTVSKLFFFKELGM